MKKILAVIECNNIPNNLGESTFEGKLIIASAKRDTTSEIDELLVELGIDKDDEKNS